MASGVKCSDESMQIYNRMKLMTSETDYQDRIKFAKFEIIKDGFVVPVTTVKNKDLEGKDVYKAFQELMPNKECCYLLYDCHYTTPDTTQDDLIFVMWTPDSASIKDKMLYASSKQDIKKKFLATKHEVEFNDPSDKEIESFEDKIGKKIVTIEGRKKK